MVELKFLWQRMKEKKLYYLIGLLFIMIMFIPTGTLEDFFTVIFWVKIFGLKIYLFVVGTLLIILATVLLNNKKAMSMLKKPSNSEAEKVCKKIHTNGKDVDVCVRNNTR